MQLTAQLPQSARPAALICGLTATLVVALSSVSAAPARGDVFRLLDDNIEAIQARVDLIQQARSEVYVVYYHVEPGHVPALLMTALCDAAQRGVRTRVLLDGFQNQIPSAVTAYLVSRGVEIREYHPLRWSRPTWINRRLHSKLLITDGQQMVIGSRNLLDEHFGLTCENYLDRDAYVQGEAVACARAYFLALWNSSDVREISFAINGLDIVRKYKERDNPLAIAWNRARLEDVASMLGNSGECLASQHLVQFHTGYDWSAGQPDVPVRFLYDECLHKGPGGTQDHFLRLIEAARSSLVIEAPYIVFSPKVQRAILAARQRGVEVLLLTNSLASTEHSVIYAAFANRKRDLLGAGIEIWEYVGPDCLHAKSMVVDGCIATIGSHNFDVRSDRKNLEVAVVVYDPLAAATVLVSMEQHMAQSFPTRRERSLLGSGSHPGATPREVARMQVQRVLVPLIRRQL